MRKFFIALLFLSLPGKSLFAQELTRFLEIDTPGYKVQNSLYKTIDFMDLREGDKMIGFVNVGLLKNQPARVFLKSPVLPQLANLLNALTDSTAKDGELLFQLKDFRFVETMGTRSCFLNASLFAKQGHQYKRLAILDTVIVVTASGVIKVLSKEASRMISDFIGQTLLIRPADTVPYSIKELENIDSIEKSKIPVYIATVYIDGVYSTYESFRNQKPDKQGVIDMKKNGNISSVKMPDANGKNKKIDPKDIYAVVYNGQPFITTEFGYYPLGKVNNEFFFTGDVKITASAGDIVGAQLALGLIGNALARQGKQETYDMIIDYLTGKFIYLRAIPKPDTN